MLKKEITFDQQVIENGNIHVRQITRFMEDGKELSKSYSRSVVQPGDDYTDLDDQTVRIMSVIHPPDVIAECEKRIQTNNKLGAKKVIIRILHKYGADIVSETLDEYNKDN